MHTQWTIVFSVLMIVQFGSTNITSHLSNMLSLKNLGEYNQLIDCVAKIRVPFTECNEQAQQKGEMVLRWVDEKSQLGTLLKCCGIWLVRDCWLNSARDQCTPEQVEQLGNMPSKMMPGLDDLCRQYPPGSLACLTPQIVVISVLIGTVLLIIFSILIIFMICRHMRRHRHESKGIETGKIGNRNDSRTESSESSEKVKLTSSNGPNSNINNNNNNNNFDFIDSDKNN